MTEKQKEFLSSYKFDRNLIFIGDVGVGKTFQAKKLLSKISDLKYQINDGKFKELLGSGGLRLRKPEEWQTPIKSYPLELMIKSKVLLFDDLGVSDVTEAYLRKLTFVLDERIAKKLPTIFTSNLSPKELENKLDKRIKSRVYLNACVLKMEGEDRRKNNILVI